jgi:serine/threonine protein kinase
MEDLYRQTLRYSTLRTAKVARFQREAKALARLSHPGIVQAYDSEEDNCRHFLDLMTG